MESLEGIKTGLGKVFWEEQIRKAKEFSGSGAEYCRRNNLNPTSFYHYKSRLKRNEPRGPKKFAQVMVKAKKDLGRSKAPLPDPAWLAQFVQGVLKER
jgi:hypothetical protein